MRIQIEIVTTLDTSDRTESFLNPNNGAICPEYGRGVLNTDNGK